MMNCEQFTTIVLYVDALELSHKDAEQVVSNIVAKLDIYATIDPMKCTEVSCIII